ncbi:MAG: YegS/Rv2252/BmrU family lipid kinase [Peptococcaceae bacterium]|nr:YegS/Rv2252/BmrU family lipid kinase [Peptococcaceae bacterium]
MLKKLALIINPIAGKGQYASDMPSMVDLFCKNGYSVTIYMTQKKGDAKAFARMYAQEYETVVCCGGDGTLSETVNGLMGLKNPPPLGYIPVGTVNDFANSLGLPKNLKKAADIILEGHPMAIDIGMLGDAYFTYIAAFGAFTDVSYTTPQEAKNILGHLAYILQGMSRLSDIPPCRAAIQYRQGALEDDYIFGGVTNSMSVAGLVKLSPDTVSLTDGLFEVLLVKSPKNLADYQKIIGSLLTREYDPACVTFLHTSEITFQFDTPIPWTLDGENGGKHESVAIRNLQGRLLVLT